MLAACGPQATPQATQPPAQEATPEAATISWWNQYSTETVQSVAPKIIEEFQALYPRITVTYEISGGPPGGGDFMEVLLSRIAGGNPPETATLFAPPSQFAARGSLLAIDDFMANATWAKPDAFYEGVLKTCQWQGKTYGLPASAGAASIIINKAKFEAKGISTKREDFPKTWAELRKLSAEFLVRENGELKQAGFVPPWSATWLYSMWSELNGGKIFDAQNAKYVIASDQNIEWLEAWVQWLDEEYGGDAEEMSLYGAWDTAYPPDSTLFKEIAAMGVEGSWATTDVAFPFEWEVMKFPVGPSGSKQYVAFWPNWFVVPKGAPHPQEAFLFIEYFATKGWETWYRAIMDTPAWKAFPRDVITAKLIDAQGQERAQDIHNFFAAYLEDAVDMWNSPIEDFASSTLGTAVEEVVHKAKGPREALQEAQGLCQAKLEETLKGG